VGEKKRRLPASAKQILRRIEPFFDVSVLTDARDLLTSFESTNEIAARRQSN
jgi:hypothetical protein